MEDYKEKLQKSIKWAWFSFVVQLGLLGVLWFFLPDVQKGFSKSSTSLLFFAWGNASLIHVFRNRYILRNPKVLEDHYLRERDERNLMIEAEAGKRGLLVVFGALYIAMILSSALHKVVFFTLLSVWIFILLVLLLTRAFYRRKM